MRSALRHRFTAAVVGLALAVPASGAVPPEVAELQYRAVLFDFYQRDYLAASTRAMAYEQQYVLGARRHDTALLLGGMLLSYGLFDAAEDTFDRLLDPSVPAAVRNRAWYHLGRLAYQRNDLDTAESALAHIEDDAEPARRGQRALLRGLIAMRRGDYRGALKVLSGRDTGVFARFNLGIAALRAGDPARGRQTLERIGRLDAQDDTLLALRDKANVALGYSALQADDTENAARDFGRVRLSGPFADQALLGAGWAATSSQHYRRALVSWDALARRNVSRPAVQEALLAAPFGLRKLGAEQQAAAAYDRAIDAYEKELARLDDALEAVRSGRMTDALRRAARRARGPDWTAQLLSGGETAAYLPELLAGHDFQRAAANFRDLYALQRHLSYWAGSMDGFDRMLTARRERYRRTAAAVDEKLADFDLTPLLARREELAGRIRRIEAGEDSLALATPEERQRISKLRALGKRLDTLPDGPQKQALRRRQQVLAGFQRWRIATDFHPRLWQARKALAALDRSIEELRDQHRSLLDAKASAHGRFGGFARRIQAARERVGRLLPRVEAITGRQRRHLEALAAQALQRRAERLRDYLAQARFAQAQLYDEARTRTNGETGQ